MKRYFDVLDEIKQELNLPLTIADRFGFLEPNHLMRFFKAQTGQTIGEYMKEYSLDKTPFQTK